MNLNSSGVFALAPPGWLETAVMSAYFLHLSGEKAGKSLVMVSIYGKCLWISVFLKKLSKRTSNFLR